MSVVRIKRVSVRRGLTVFVILVLTFESAYQSQNREHGTESVAFQPNESLSVALGDF